MTCDYVTCLQATLPESILYYKISSCRADLTATNATTFPCFHGASGKVSRRPVWKPLVQGNSLIVNLLLRLCAAWKNLLLEVGNTRPASSIYVIGLEFSIGFTNICFRKGICRKPKIGKYSSPKIYFQKHRKILIRFRKGKRKIISSLKRFLFRS